MDSLTINNKQLEILNNLKHRKVEKYFKEVSNIRKLIISLDTEEEEDKNEDWKINNFNIVIDALKYCPKIKIIRIIELPFIFDIPKIKKMTNTLMMTIAIHSEKIIDLAISHCSFRDVNNETLQKVVNNLEIFYCISYLHDIHLMDLEKVLRSFTYNNNLRIFFWSREIIEDEILQDYIILSFLHKVKNTLEIFDVSFLPSQNVLNKMGRICKNLKYLRINIYSKCLKHCKDRNYNQLKLDLPNIHIDKHDFNYNIPLYWQNKYAK